MLKPQPRVHLTKQSEDKDMHVFAGRVAEMVTYQILEALHVHHDALSVRVVAAVHHAMSCRKVGLSTSAPSTNFEGAEARCDEHVRAVASQAVQTDQQVTCGLEGSGLHRNFIEIGSPRPEASMAATAVCLGPPVLRRRPRRNSSGVVSTKIKSDIMARRSSRASVNSLDVRALKTNLANSLLRQSLEMSDKASVSEEEGTSESSEQEGSTPEKSMSNFSTHQNPQTSMSASLQANMGDCKILESLPPVVDWPSSGEPPAEKFERLQRASSESVLSMWELRKRHSTELAMTLHKIVPLDGSNIDGCCRHSSLLPLRVSGVLAWQSTSSLRSRRSWCCSSSWHQNVILLSAVFALGCFLEHATNNLLHGEPLQMSLLANLSLSIGSVVGLLALRYPVGEKGFKDFQGMLLRQAVRQGILEEWTSLAWKDSLVAFGCWLCLVLARVCIFGVPPGDNARGWLQLGSFVVMSTVVLSLTTTLLHVCRPLGLMVDAFCCTVIDTAGFVKAANDWNILQAVLRKASSTMECCFFVLQLVAFFTASLLITDVWLHSWMIHAKPWLYLPEVLLIAGIVRVFLYAGAITDKCAHVPSYINALTCEEDLDQNRRHLVEYIIHSEAGFYVYEVRLTSAMGLKFAYFSCVILFGVMARVIADFHD